MRKGLRPRRKLRPLPCRAAKPATVESAGCTTAAAASLSVFADDAEDSLRYERQMASYKPRARGIGAQLLCSREILGRNLRLHSKGVVRRKSETMTMRGLIPYLYVAALMASAAVHAEAGCPPGQMPVNASAPEGSAQSMASCAPIPTNPRGPSWRTRWGAIASDESGSFGIVTGIDSERKATKAALAKCARSGSKSCALDMTFRNQCAAVVANGTQVFIERAPYEEQAIAAGKTRCEESKAVECWVHYSGCSLPARVR